MKIALIIIRSLLGAMLLFASIPYLFHLMAMPAPTGDTKIYMDGISTVHLMPIVKSIELLCGLAFITGRFNTLAAVVIFPILFNILLFHSFIGEAKEALLPVLLIIADLFIAWYYRYNYRTLFAAK